MNRTIYVVEDDASVREALVFLINSEPDIEICGTAETATDALNALAKMSPDLVLTDLSLPGMDGFQFIERLLARAPGQRTAMISGHSEPHYTGKAITAGARGYILKENPRTIMKAIRRVLDDVVYRDLSAGAVKDASARVDVDATV